MVASCEVSTGRAERVEVVLVVNVMFTAGSYKYGAVGGKWGGRKVHILVKETLSVINHRVVASSAR